MGTIASRPPAPESATDAASTQQRRNSAVDRTMMANAAGIRSFTFLDL